MEITINNKYKSLWTSDKRYNIVTGGRGSGKSFSVTLYLLTLTFQKNQIILFTRYTLVSAKISIIPQFLEVMELLGYDETHFDITKDEIINRATGSKIIFKGIKTSSGVQTANLKSITGVSCFVLDEAEELDDEKIFDKIDLSVRVKTATNKVILVMNPTTKESWIYKRWFELGQDKQTNYIHTDYRDNIDNLDESIIRQIEAIKSNNIDKYNHQILGGWLNKAEGVIYEDWEDGEFNDDLPYLYGLDFGSNDPDALTKVAVDQDNKVIYLKEVYFKNNTSYDALRHVLEQRVGFNDLIIGDAAERRIIRDLYNEGFNIKKARKGKGSVDMGIKTIQSYTLIVDPESINIKRALNNYVWHDKKAGVPDHDWSDLCDSFRYAVMDIINFKVAML